MRTLTIERKKSFVGSIAALKVYIEDPLAGELTINGVRCRKLGTLKNGETGRFVIDEQAAKVYVIADKLSKDVCNEYYPLEAGSEDVHLSGRPHFDPARGNAFRFDGVNDPTVLNNRKRGGRKGLMILAAAVLLGLLVGLVFGIGTAGKKNSPKTFTESDFQITLTNRFFRLNAEQQNYQYAYASQQAEVVAYKEQFALFRDFELPTLKEYARYAIQYSIPGEEPKVLQGDGYVFAEYGQTFDDGAAAHYLTAFYQSDDAFWIVDFLCDEEDYPKLQEQFHQWAATVEFP